MNQTSKTIGMLMKEGKKEEAEIAKQRVAEIKEVNKAIQAEMDQAAEDMQNLLYTIPNVPYDEVPEGVGADDNKVEKDGRYGNGTAERRTASLGIGKEI